MEEAPKQVTLARKVGTSRHQTLNGESMDMGYVDPVKYIRADLFPKMPSTTGDFIKDMANLGLYIHFDGINVFLLDGPPK